MKRLAFAFLVAATTAAVCAGETITNDDVVRMAKAGLSPETIEMKIKYSDTSFDTSTDALITLKSAGVTDATIRMMIEKQKDTPVAAKPPEPNPSPAPEPAKAESSAVPLAANPSSTCSSSTWRGTATIRRWRRRSPRLRPARTRTACSVRSHARAAEGMAP